MQSSTANVKQRDYATELESELCSWPVVMPAITEWMDDHQVYQAKDHYYKSAIRKHNHNKIITDFALNYGNEKPTKNDPNYDRFKDNIAKALAIASRNGYDHKFIDYNFVYTLAILGSLHPVHIPETVDACEIIQKCIDKHIPELKVQRVKLKVHRDWSCQIHGRYWAKMCPYNDDEDELSQTDDDTLYYYLLYELVRESRHYSVFGYTWDPDQQYRSGVVYHLLQGGCQMTSRCLDVLLAFRYTERAVQHIKDFIFVTGDIEKYECRITSYILSYCTRSQATGAEYDDTYYLNLNAYKHVTDALEEREILMFWEVAQLDLFCRHHVCLDTDYMKEREYGVSVINAMRTTPKSLKHLCRMSIRKCLDPTTVVRSCHQLTLIPPKLRDFISFGSLDAAIKPFYNMADLREVIGKDVWNKEAVWIQEKDRIRSLVHQHYNIKPEHNQTRAQRGRICLI